MKKIVITGTKGKSTVSGILAEVLMVKEPKVLHVDTTGAFINEKMIISKDQSVLAWGLVPTVAPGRFLYLLNDPSLIDAKSQRHSSIDGVAVLEASIGCGTSSGLGFYGHDIGIFTNVFEDHLGSRSDLDSREDIGKSKKFVFSRIKHGGYAVFNADDDIICANLNSCDKSVILLPFGINFEYFDIQKHLDDGGLAVTAIDNSIVILKKDEKIKVLDLSDVSWTFNGKFLPSVYNLLSIVGALIGYGNGSILPEFIGALKKSKLDPSYGRLVVLKNKQNVTILADYAHEKQSLKSVAKLAGGLKQSEANQVIGVLRLAWDRTDKLIEETAKYIANDYDYFVIYDKIDGYWHNPNEAYNKAKYRFTQEVGKVSGIMADTLREELGNNKVTRILREDEAIKEAAKLAKPGDVVVIIVNDDIKRSIDFIKLYFKAELV